MSEYVEFYGDHVFLVQMIPNIAQISIFINFIKNRIFYIFSYFLNIKKKKGPAECAERLNPPPAPLGAEQGVPDRQQVSPPSSNPPTSLS